MRHLEERIKEAELARLARVKHRDHPMPQVFGAALVEFHKSVKKRQTKFAKIAEVWEVVIPQQIFGKNCCLESFAKGTLTVLVDSSSHLFELKTLLLSGAEQQLRLACTGTGLKKVQLKRGKWYVEKGGDDGQTIGRELTF